MACWVRFTQDFPWHVPEFKGRVTIFYKAGTTRFVKDDCAERAIARRNAVVCESPRHATIEDEKAAEVQPGETITPKRPRVAAVAAGLRPGEAVLDDPLADEPVAESDSKPVAEPEPKPEPKKKKPVFASGAGSSKGTSN